jgi:MFS family permease
MDHDNSAAKGFGMHSMEQKEKNLVVTSLAHGFNHGITSLHSVAIPLLISHFVLTHSEAGLISTLFYLAYSLISLPAGKYSTTFGRKNLIMFYLLGGFALTMVTGFSPTYFFLLFSQVIAGAMFGIYHPSGVVLIVNSYEKRRGKALGYHEVGGMGGALAAVFMGGIVAKLWGWRYLFYIFSIPGILIALLCFFWAKEEGSAEEVSKGDKGEMNLRAVTAIILCTGLQLMCVTGFRTWCPALLMKKFGIGIMPASFLSALLPAASMVASPIFGHVSDRFGREFVLHPVLMIFSLSLIGIAYANSLGLMTVILIITGAVYIAIVPIGNAYLSEAIPKSKSGYIFGIHNMVMFLMTTIAPVTVGAMADAFSFTSGMVLLACISLLGTLILIFVPKRKVQLQSH